MCGRFTLRASPKEIADLFSVEVQLELLPRFNICPTQNVLAIRARAGESAGNLTRREAVESGAELGKGPDNRQLVNQRAVRNRGNETGIPQGF